MEISKEHFNINKNDLANECVKQAGLYEYYAEELANAKEIKDKASTKLELVEAEVQLKFREYASSIGMKVTEAIVTANTIRDEAYQAAKESLIEATKNVNTLQAAVAAMEQKCSMLQTLQRMQSSVSYNIEPQFNGKDTAEYAEKVLNDQLTNKLGNRL